MNLTTVLKRTWTDWAVAVYTAVTAARCKSPFLIALFTAVALTAAVIGIRKTRQLIRAETDARH
ncbi:MULTISPECIES: hypothetical protein [unclassified Streptomyces]|uniref:hypothetical protein n=1 Tax=unclassified Streptomyces TaxID=2593676 RepID=UPI00093C57DC|nr:hypothetical protein [Streptomyces sp. TSRI0281]OKI37103.1 hypothetical protein A6A29_41090 [Streptomyces sp. TSRI0281]